MLRAIAVDEARAVSVARARLIGPYDGGVDLILPDAGARDRFRERYAAWRSPRADGL